MRAGAMGFTTSPHAQPRDRDRPPGGQPRRHWAEVRALVGVMGDLGGGIFEIAGEDIGRNQDRQHDYFGRLRDLAVETGVPVTWGMFSSRRKPDAGAPTSPCSTRPRGAGGRMFAQVHSRAVRTLCCRSRRRLPFDRLPEWSEMRRRPLDEQRGLCRDADRAPAAGEGGRRGRVRPRRRRRGPQARLRLAAWSWTDPCGPHRVVAEMAARARCATPPRP